MLHFNIICNDFPFRKHVLSVGTVSFMNLGVLVTEENGKRMFKHLLNFFKHLYLSMLVFWVEAPKMDSVRIGYVASNGTEFNKVHVSSWLI